MATYKIRNSKGLFSTGGTDPVFNKDGKVWTSEATLKCHLTQYMTCYPGRYRLVPDDWQIVEFVENPLGQRPARELAARPAKK